MPWIEFQYSDAAALAGACAGRIGRSIDEALAERAHALLALSGGSTSPAVLRRLAAQSRNWNAVTILPTDERWVPSGHPDSNLRSLRAALAGADGVRWCPLVPDIPGSVPDASFANAALAACPKSFDLCMLGMGTDGHFASLLSGAPNLVPALDPAGSDAAVAIVPDPMPIAGPHPRISLTLSRLLNSRRLMLVITGADKLTVLRRAQRQVDAERLPIAALLRASHAVAEIHWSPW